MRILVMLLALGADGLGPALRQDGYSLRPPSQFHLTRMDLFHGTRVGAIGFSAEPTGFLSAALTDADPDDSSMLLISVGDSTFPSGPTARDALATAVVRHFQDDLGIRFSLLTAASIQDRVEVEGGIGEGTQARHILVAAWPHADRHVVVTASVPEVRWAQLKPVLHESLDTMRFEPPLRGTPVAVVWAVAGVTFALLVTSIAVWRRRARSAAR